MSTVACAYMRSGRQACRYSCHLVRVVSVLHLLFLSCFFPSTSASGLYPSSLSHTVHTYLEQEGGYEKLQQAFNLSEHVYYNPISFYSRDHMTDRLAHPSEIDDTPSMADVEILRAMGMHIPGIDPEISVRQSSQGTCRNAEYPAMNVKGLKSTFSVLFTKGTPVAVKDSVRFAVQKWANDFDSDKVTIRICFVWTSNGISSETLGATSAPYLVLGRGAPQLRPECKYTPALAAAILDRDMVDPDKFHVHMILNSGVNWHLDISSRSPPQKYDLPTTVMHELTHGLFFSGTITVDHDKRSGEFAEKEPGRFDMFMQVEGNISVSRSCGEGNELFRASTSPNLRFVDPLSRSNFGLFAPWPFSSGSSLYHFNNTLSLNKDCERLNIRSFDCSDLMTHELVSGYTQRSLGETTLRVYRAMKSLQAGVQVGGSCRIRDYSGRGGTTSPNGSSGFQMPIWAIGVVAGVGALGVIFLIAVIFSSVSKK